MAENESSLSIWRFLEVEPFYEKIFSSPSSSLAGIVQTRGWRAWPGSHALSGVTGCNILRKVIFKLFANNFGCAERKRVREGRSEGRHSCLMYFLVTVAVLKGRVMHTNRQPDPQKEDRLIQKETDTQRDAQTDNSVLGFEPDCVFNHISDIWGYVPDIISFCPVDYFHCIDIINPPNSPNARNCFRPN